MEDGQVQWKDMNLVFPTPSAWASHCKRLVNPDQKNACGWTTVKYEGKKLDWYKNKWLQMHGHKTAGSDGGGSPHGTQVTKLKSDFLKMSLPFRVRKVFARYHV